MFRLFQNQLTEYNNHYVDWSRVGELYQSAKHHYTAEQLLTRSAIIACTAVSAYLGYNLNNEENTHCSNSTISIASGLIGFTLSHAVVIYPLIKKRREMSQECDRLKNEITHLSQNSECIPFKEIINVVVNKILDISLSDQDRSRASETWGRRKNLLIKVSELLKDDNFNPRFWQNNANTIIENLNNCNNENKLKFR